MKSLLRLLLSYTAAFSLLIAPIANVDSASAAISQNPYYFDGMVTPALVDGEYRSAFPNWDNYTDTWYFADHDSGRVIKFDQNGNFLGQLGNTGAEQTPLNYPHDVGVNSQGYIFVSDSESVKAFNAQGTLVAKDVYANGALSNGWISGTHITTDDAGNLYACAYLGSSTKIVKLTVAQGRINAQTVMAGDDTCNKYGGQNLQVSADGQVILAAGSPGTIVWANIGGTWTKSFEFKGSDWSSYGNYWLSDIDGTYEVSNLSYDKTTLKIYDPLTGELIRSTSVTNSSGLPLPRNRSTYFDGNTHFVLSGPNSIWLQSNSGLRKYDFASGQQTSFGVTNLGSVNKVSVSPQGNVSFSDYLGNFVTVNSSGQLVSKVQLGPLPFDITSASLNEDGTIIASYVNAQQYSSAALFDPQGNLLSDYGAVRGLTSFTPTSTGWFPSIHRAYPTKCQILSESNGTYAYFGTRYGNTVVDESCGARGSAQVQIVNGFDTPSETYRSVTLTFPDDARAYVIGNLAVAPNGNILLAVESENIWVFNPNGSYLGVIAQPRATAQNRYGTLDFDSEGNLYVGYGAGIARFKSLKTFTPTARPAIVGKAAVGSTLTCDAGVWDANASLTYQWLRDGAAVAGANSPTLVVSSGDFGHTLSVQVTGTAVGYSEVSQTSASKIVVAGSFVSAPTPSIQGDFHTGSNLTAVSGLWDSNAQIAFEWLRDGEPIIGATSSQYTSTGDDFNHQVSVRVTGSASGYVTAQRSSPSVLMGLGDQPNGTVQVAGVFSVGQQLTANVFSSTPISSSTYQWLRDGNELIGETAASYVLTPSDLNHALSVRAISVSSGYRDATAESTPQKVLLGSLAGNRTVEINGTPYAGKSVAVSITGTSDSESLSYKWFIDGVEIAQETQDSYLLSGSDFKKHISVRVTFAKNGFRNLVVETQPQPVELAKESQGLSLGGLDLHGRDLAFYNFKDANLSGSNFNSADLSYVNFKGANLASSNLATANLTFADFSGANLGGADLSNGNAAFTLFVGANLNNANVTGLSLDGRDFSQVDLSGVRGQLATPPAQLPTEWAVVENRLVGPTANLSGANFSKSSLKNLNLAGADLSNANLIGADLTGTNLSGANLTGVTFHPSSPDATSIFGVKTVGSELSISQSTWTRGITYNYQWFVNGIALQGANAPTLVMSSTMYGKRLSLRVEATYRVTSLGSVTTPTVLIGAGTMATKSVRISGSAKVNGTLQVKAATWVEGAKIKYQWFLDGKAIKGATGATLKVLATYKGRSIFARIYQDATGYKSSTVASNTLKIS